MTRIRTLASRTLALTLATALAVVLSACGGEKGPEMGTVSGKITFKGKNVEAGTVNFVPTDANGTPANGNIAPDGTYSLQTTNPGDGARLGNYKVGISGKDPNAMNNPLPGAPNKVTSSIPEKYENPDSSGLTATVKSGKNTLDFTLD